MPAARDGDTTEKTIERLREHAITVADAAASFAEPSSNDAALLQVIAHKMARAVGGFCGIAIVSADGASLDPVGCHDDDDDVRATLEALAFSRPLPMADAPAVHQVFGSAQVDVPYHFDDAFLARRFANDGDRARMQALQISQGLLVALRVRGQNLGVCTVFRHGADARAIDDDERRMARSIADHAALAIANTRLLRDLERELAERARAEARTLRIVDTAHEGIWVTDVDRKTTFVNRRLGEILRAAPADLLGRSALDFIPVDQMHESDERMDRRRAGIGEQIEVKLLRADGTEVEAAVSVGTLTDESGAFAGSVALITDQTERKAVEEELRHAQRLEAVGQLAGGIAHDFNNLLSVILGFTEMALDDLLTGDPMRHDLMQVLTAARRAADLTRQILAFSRQRVAEMRVLDLNQLVNDLLPMLRRLMRADIVIDVALADGLGRVEADPGDIEQELVSLMGRARNAMSAGGRIRIATANVGDEQVSLSVSDGREPARVLVFPRTGAALSLAPVVESRPRASGETILVVDDDEQVRTFIASSLKRAGYTVLAAADAALALDISRQHRGAIDLLLSDVVLRESNGAVLATQFRAARPAAKVLFMSGEPLGKSLGDVDGAAFIDKPLTLTALLTKLRALLVR